jgi:hypothetical protein
MEILSVNSAVAPPIRTNFLLLTSIETQLMRFIQIAGLSPESATSLLSV